MAAIALCPLAALLLTCAKADMDTYNGWRPIPRERVFNWMETALQVADGDALIPVVEGPKVDFREPVGARVNVEPGVSIVLPVNRRYFDASSNLKSETHDLPHRRGKKLDFIANVASNYIANEKYDNTGSNEMKPEVINNTYEVVESTTEELVTEQNIITREENYDYEENKGNNLTDNLLRILSNYNVRYNDRLSNYALSLKRKGAESNGYVYIRMPLGYNSPNHAPVNPLLAVLLSNYGHYIPGQYGFQHNYRNLYGYAASNNIHNNKPFGAYKIFADTDSSL